MYGMNKYVKERKCNHVTRLLYLN